VNINFEHPVDGWYHLELKGEHPNPAGKVIQVIDVVACETIVNRFNQDADAGNLSHGHEMLIDHEHFKHDTGKETIAYGWLQRLQNRDDGIYGQIRWSATGRKAVDGGDYRFFSTEYDPADLKVVNGRAGTPFLADGAQGTARPTCVRPMRLAGLTLTNDPNNKGASPITNRHNETFETMAPESPGGRNAVTEKNRQRETFETMAPESPGGRNAVTKNNQKQNAAPSERSPYQNRNRNMKNIATKLGLAAEASEDAVLEAVTKIQNRVAQLEPLAAENEKLTHRVSELDASSVEALLTAHGVKDAKVLNRMKPILLATKVDDRQACLEEIIPKASLGSTEADDRHQSSHHRKVGPGPIPIPAHF
jgi:phage I-like protein